MTITNGLILTIGGILGIIVCTISLTVNHKRFKKQKKILFDEIENE
ncbi:hypothetical protein [Thomasclavelia sp.]|nr:hypothetical protein [Thomasclavelia sp.]